MALVVYQGPGSADSAETGSNVDEFGGYTATATATGVGSNQNGRAAFVGLSNQGATCYLNGLLQTLFMTPEFRRAVLAWPYSLKEGETEDQCIPLQLQKLFGLLQLSNNRSIDTVALTKSFGWDSMEVFQQQDVQELTRVLFDVLEESFKGTEVENMIDLLYAGELIDYIRCIDVDYSSERNDKFLDFSLAIVPFGSEQALHSLSECIETFLRPEILDGDNKYYAEKFDKKVDAIKGLKFGRLPPILSVQLKRFVYDFSGDVVIQKKLNDQVKFPMILDMNKYVATRTVQTDCGEPSVVSNEEFEDFLKEQLDLLTKKNQESSSAPHPTTATIYDSYREDESASESKVSYGESLYDVDLTATSVNLCGEDAATEESHVNVKMESADKNNSSSSSSSSSSASVNYDSMTDEEVQQLIKDGGEWIYELYAVLIHSGAITGGHYFAYIKDLESKRWWSFNDSNVTPIDESTVREAWGGPVTPAVSTYHPYGSTYGNYYNSYSHTYYSNPTPILSSSNAYMLMYRKVSSDPSFAVSFPSDDLVPEHVKSIIRQEEELKASRLKADLELKNRLFVRIVWNSVEHTIRCQRTDTYEALMETLWNTLKLDSHCNNVSSNSSCSTQSLKSPAMVLDLPKPPADNDNDNGNNHIATVSAPRPDSPSSYGAVGDKSEVSEVTTVNDMNDFNEAVSADGIPAPEVSKFSLFRLRSYNVHTFIKSEPIDFEVSKLITLGDLGFSDYRTYMVETRKPGESWEVFYSDGFTLLLEEFDGVSFSFKDPRSVRFRKGFTLRDVKEVITKWVVYPEDCIQLLKVVNFGLYEARKEILIGDDKPLSELCVVTDPMKLIFERIDSKQSFGDEIRSISSISTSTGGGFELDKDVESLAFEAYLSKRHHMELKVNKPPDAAVTSVQADSRWTLTELRAAIAKVYELDPNNIKMYRGYGQTTNQEIKENHSTIALSNIYSGQQISVTVGKATPAGFYPLTFVLFTPKDHKSRLVPFPKEEATDQPMIELSDPDKVSTENSNYYWNEAESSYSFGQVAEKENYEWGFDQYYEGDPAFDAVDPEMPGLIPAQEVYSAQREEFVNTDVLLEDDNLDTMSNEGVADSAECFSAVAEDDMVMHDDGCGNFSSLKGEINSSERTESYRTFGPDSSTQETIDGCDSYNHSSYNYSYPNESCDLQAAIAASTSDSQVVSVQGQTEEFHQSTAVADAYPVLEVSHEVSSTVDSKLPATAPADVISSDTTHIRSVFDDDYGMERFDRTDDNIDPSDFGERMVRTSNCQDQFTPLELEGMYYENGSSIQKLRADLHQRLIEKGMLPSDSSPKRIRIRDKVGNTPSRILVDGKTFLESLIFLFDGKQLSIEIVDEEEDMSGEDSSSVCLLIQRWVRSTWSLGEKFEVYLSGSLTVGEVTRGLCKLTGVSPHSVMAMVVPKDVEFYLSELNQKSPRSNYGRSWFDPNQESYKLLKYTSHDMRVQDGDLLLLQDTSEPLMTLSPADLKSIKIVEAASSVTYGGWGTSNVVYPTTSDQVCYPSNQTKSLLYSNKTGTSTSAYQYSYPAAVTSTPSKATGIFIKTYKDREKQKEEEKGNPSTPSMDSTVGSYGAVDMYGPGIGDTSNNISDISESKEFRKQGGLALFDDII